MGEWEREREVSEAVRVWVCDHLLTVSDVSTNTLPRRSTWGLGPGSGTLGERETRWRDGQKNEQMEKQINKIDRCTETCR